MRRVLCLFFGRGVQGVCVCVCVCGREEVVVRHPYVYLYLFVECRYLLAYHGRGIYSVIYECDEDL